jgi:hypothetical protein
MVSVSAFDGIKMSRLTAFENSLSRAHFKLACHAGKLDIALTMDTSPIKVSWAVLHVQWQVLLVQTI